MSASAINPSVAQTALQPVASKAIIRELHAQTVVSILAALTSLFVLVLKLVKAWRNRGDIRFAFSELWLVRVLHKPKGAYLLWNSILLWHIVSLGVGTTVAACLILTAIDSSPDTTVKNLTLWQLVPFQTLGFAAWQVMTGTTVTWIESRPLTPLPGPIIFHGLTVVFPLGFFTTGVVLVGMLNNIVEQLRELAQDMSEKSTIELLASLSVMKEEANALVAKQKSLTMGFTIVNIVWMILITVVAIPPAVAVIFAIRKTIASNEAASSSSVESGTSTAKDARRRLASKRKNQFMLLFFVWGISWILVSLAIILWHVVESYSWTAEQIMMDISADKLMRVQFVDIYWSTITGMFITAIVLLVRDLYGFSETSAGTSQSQARASITSSDDPEVTKIMRSKQALFRLASNGGDDREVEQEGK